MSFKKTRPQLQEATCTEILGRFGSVVLRCVKRQTYSLITVLRCPAGGGVNITILKRRSLIFSSCITIITSHVHISDFRYKYTLFHSRTRAFYVYNGCLAWYDVELTPWVHSSVKFVGLPLATRATVEVLYNCLSSYKFVCTHLNHSRQLYNICLLYTSPSPRDRTRSRMPSSA